jgi:RNA polymerase sigma factor (TIGR02999 family)
MEENEPLTKLLVDWGSGRPEAADAIIPILYRELRKVAAARLRSERAGHTLQPTALVNEAYMKLIGSAAQNWENRAHFLTFASHIMRQILTDHSRKFRAAKRGGGNAVTQLNDGVMGLPARESGLIELNEALTALDKLFPRKAKIVEMKYFGGMTGEEIAEALQIGTATVTRELRMAEAWLRRYIAGSETED